MPRLFWNSAGTAARLEDFTLIIVACPSRTQAASRAFLAAHEQGEPDFTTGVTVDMGAASTMNFDVLNVEGEGFGGMQSLLASPSIFGVVRRMIVTSTTGSSGTKLAMDGMPARARDRGTSVLDVDRVTVVLAILGLRPIFAAFSTATSSRSWFTTVC